jgi:short-subunit dehydrogenase
VNNAGISIYGRIEEVDLNDARRMFDTDFWGVVHGSRIALQHLRERGGALINVGSTVSDRAIPLQGFYVASKHAVKGFTDSLRMEIEEAKLPVSVTLIKPAGINTPFTQHAKNYMPNEPDFPPPVYAPGTVARSILHAATHVVRDIMVGGAAKTFNVGEKYMPRLTDRYMEKTMFSQQQKPRPRERRPDALYRAGEGLMEDGNYEGHVMRTSAYTSASLHPIATIALLGLAGVAAAAALLMTTEAGREMSEDYLNV